MADTKILTVEERLAALESRMTAVESAGPKEIRIAKPDIKSTNQHFREELASLQSDPQSRIETLIAGGLTEKQAAAWVPGRIAYLKDELGIKTPAKKAAKAAAALIIGLIALALTLFAQAAQAGDQQGYPQQYVYNTNFPVIVNAGSTSNLLSPLGVANYALTNSVTIHRGAGIGLAWLFNGNSTFGTQYAGLIVAPSIDGTNIDSWQQWVLVGRGFGTTNAIATTNWNANQLAGYKALFLLAITNLGTGVLTNGGTFTTTNSGAGGYTTNIPVASWNVPQGGP